MKEQKKGHQPKWKILHLRRHGKLTRSSARQDIERVCRTNAQDRNDKKMTRALLAKDGKPLDYGLFHFASWVFGQNGLADLEILAFGDFSNNNRYSDRNILLVPRSARPLRDAPRYGEFKSIEYANIEHHTSVNEAYDFLNACPSDKLVGFDERDCEWPGPS